MYFKSFMLSTARVAVTKQFKPEVNGDGIHEDQYGSPTEAWFRRILQGRADWSDGLKRFVGEYELLVPEALRATLRPRSHFILQAVSEADRNRRDSSQPQIGLS
jgi:hypothetical protein